MPIRTKRVVQTGAKIQSGGLNDGFVRVAYQVGIEGLVKIEPIKPANRQIVKLVTSLRVSGNLVFLILYLFKLILSSIHYMLGFAFDMMKLQALTG
jgi:hypothetical protein